jgi:hypothetical protein
VSPPQTAHDAPYPGRPHRVYVALTNHCNRSCPWCSTCSSPQGATFLDVPGMLRTLPDEGPFELQLEGGEPTVHPDFFAFVEAARAEPRLTRLVLSTNGVRLPRAPAALRDFVLRLGQPLVIKLSVNHHLLERDAGLLDLAASLRELFAALGPERLLVLNVRLRRGAPDDDRWVEDAVRARGLIDLANVFPLQRYGFASEETSWEPPHLVGYDFRLVSPDGAVFGPDLIARSEGMRRLPQRRGAE